MAADPLQQCGNHPRAALPPPGAGSAQGRVAAQRRLRRAGRWWSCGVLPVAREHRVRCTAEQHGPAAVPAVQRPLPEQAQHWCSSVAVTACCTAGCQHWKARAISSGAASRTRVLSVHHRQEIDRTALTGGGGAAGARRGRPELERTGIGQVVQLFGENQPRNPLVPEHSVVSRSVRPLAQRRTVVGGLGGLRRSCRGAVVGRGALVSPGLCRHR